MSKLVKVMDKAIINGKNKVYNFVNAEDGDTNFISMLLIIGIAVCIGTLFLTFAKGTVWPKIQQKINTFMSAM